MKFEIFNGGKRVFVCTEKECLPDLETIKMASKEGYKIKIDGKTAAVRAAVSYIREHL